MGFYDRRSFIPDPPPPPFCDGCKTHVTAVVDIVDPCFAGDDNGGQVFLCAQCAKNYNGLDECEVRL